MMQQLEKYNTKARNNKTEKKIKKKPKNWDLASIKKASK